MSWSTVKLSDILKRRRETIKIVPDQDYKLVTIRLYHKGVVLRTISKGADIRSTMSVVKAGDFILSGIDARNGAFGIVPAELDGAIVTNDFWCLDPDEKLIGKEFLLFLTSTDFFDNICRQSSDGTTQRIRLQKDKFYNYEINLPPLKEQAVILKKLKETKSNTELISTELTHQLTLVKKLRQQLLQDAVQGKLVPQDKNDEPASELLKKIKAEKAKSKKNKELPAIKLEEIPFQIPDNWVWCRLGEITNFIDYRGKTPNKVDSGIKLITAKNVKYGYFSNEPEEFISVNDFDSHMTRGIPNKGDILFTTEAPLGNACLLDINQKFALAQRIITIQPIHFFSVFLLNTIISKTIQNQLIKKQSGATAQGIKSSRLIEVLIPLPPLTEQHRIVAKLEELMQTCDELEASVLASKGQNEQLLQQVLREALTNRTN